MIQRTRKSKWFKTLIIFQLLSLLNLFLLPVETFALTGGPSQPEVQGFEPIGTSDMVNLFTGDFKYNIPLLDVGGYPINLSYQGGIGMDQEASWTGLGWSLNAGVLNRAMRGLPDDFKGDEVIKEMNTRPNRVFGGNLAIGNIEVIGAPIIKLDLGIGAFYNNYKGIGFERSLDVNIGIGDKQKGKLNIGLGLTANSQEGIGINPSLGLSMDTDKISSIEGGASSFSANLGASYNSRSGLKALSFGVTASSFITNGKKGKDFQSRSTQPINGGASIPMSLQTYTPQINFPMGNSSKMVHAGVGLEGWWVNGKGKLSGYFNEQKLLFKKQSSNAYGYLYAEEGQNNSGALMDFNREKDGSFTRNTPSLPLTNFTYDAFSISAQGVGGMYRPFRADVGTVFDNQVTSFSHSARIGVDFGSANTVKGGANGGFNFNISSSGPWSGANAANTNLSFKERSSVSSSHIHSYEPYYFKQAGEMVPVDQNFHAQLGEEHPVRLEITDEGNLANLKRKTSLSSTAEQNLSLPDKKVDREKRNQVLSILTAEQADNFALEKKIKSYKFSNPQTGDEIISTIGRTDIAEDHHLSELTALRPDGARYVFGIPAYNLKQRDVSFNVTGSIGNCTSGQVSYDPNTDNSTNNTKGLDNYFSATELPPFSHSYLLTAVLSPDYFDRLGDGPTDDDFGNYTKLNYSKMDSVYHWRVPYKLNSANFNESLKADESDDKGSYSYGERENWYLHSIETKTHKAEFYTSDRKDGFGVQGENGGLNLNNPVQRLDSIKLFALCDRLSKKDTAEVIKAVHFRYSYKLCPNVPNNSGDIEIVDNVNVNLNRGKLTLDKVFFTYGKSKKGMLSPYQFYYGDTDDNGIPEPDFNPPYNLKGYDRWGNYKYNQATNCDPLSTGLSNAEFPYVIQEKALTDKYAAAWSINRIQLPSGGEIKVNYESDDYAYVQDKRAMQMIEVNGIGPNVSSLTGSPLIGNLYANNDENLFLKIKLPQAISNPTELKEKYFLDEEKKEIKSMFFKFMIDVIGRPGGLGNDEDAYEYVSGYADIESFGLIGTSAAWIKLKSVSIGDKAGGKQINPILKTAFQFARLHLSKMVYPGSDRDENQLANAIRGLLGFMMDLRTMATGFNKTLQDWNFSKKVILPKSRVRLFAPTHSNSNGFSHSKLGGGARVKKVTISDSWTDMVEHGETSEYGQEYFYTTINEYGEKISSGVAEYEPMIGNEENPFRQQVAFTDEHKMAPDNQFYKETPFGESFFPSPNVGYSEVKVRNLQHTKVKRNATGLVRHLFYTAKDFPVYTDQTKLESKSAKPSWLKKILKKDIKERMVVSQGFAIYLNNMHGQQKGQWVYPEYPDNTPADEYQPISGVEYFYQTQSNNPKHLNNEVKAISKTGSIAAVTVGKEIDLVSDMRENKTEMAGFTFAFNLDVSILPPAPVPIPSFWPTFSKEETLFRSTTMTKVVTQYGILEKTIAYDLGSRVSTENLAFDGETGELLVTKTKNDFEDPIYSYTYPAHLAYDNGMGMAYKNLGVLFESGDYSNTNGTVTFGGIHEPSYFTEGDELSAGTNRFWVTQVNPSNIKIVDKDGASPSSLSGSVRIIKSGRKNMQVTPIGTITSKINPIAGGSLHTFSEVDKIINAGAVEFSDDWNGFCECGIDINDEVGLKNPYILGWKGNWRAKRSFLFLTDRNQASLNRNTNIREDGIYSKFDRYWMHDGLGHWNPNNGALGGFNNWTFTSEVTLFSPYGFELENRDALKRYSSAVYGFNQTLPTAVASNARYSEIGFDSFEDYDCKSCTDDHFSFSESTRESDISKTESHSGYRSIRVGPNQKVSIIKNLVPCPENDAIKPY